MSFMAGFEKRAVSAQRYRNAFIKTLHGKIQKGEAAAKAVDSLTGRVDKYTQRFNRRSDSRSNQRAISNNDAREEGGWNFGNKLLDGLRSGGLTEKELAEHVNNTVKGWGKT